MAKIELIGGHIGIMLIVEMAKIKCQYGLMLIIEMAKIKLTRGHIGFNVLI